MAAIIVALLVIAIGVMAFLNWNASRALEQKQAATTNEPTLAVKKSKKEKAGDTTRPRTTSAPPEPAPIPTPKPPEPTGPKAIADLKTGGVKLEKATGSSLVYAVGMLTNDSGHQRYGVRIEINLSDATGKPAGIAKDYRQVLEPGEAWRFRGLILDARARSGAVSGITEDP